MLNHPKLPTRFWDKVQVVRHGRWKCWEWTASTHGHGYASFKLNGKSTYGHIVAYEALVGPVPDGLVLDHRCRNRKCVRPSHLDPVTHRVNILLGEGWCAEQARKTRCDNGHEFTPENTSERMDARKSPGRRCKQCLCDASRRYRRRKVAT